MSLLRSLFIGLLVCITVVTSGPMATGAPGLYLATRQLAPTTAPPAHHAARPDQTHARGPPVRVLT